MSDIHSTALSSGRMFGGILCCAGLLAPILAAGMALEAHMARDAGVTIFLLAGWGVASLLILSTLRAHPHPRFGPANALTSGRAAGVLILAALALDTEPSLPDRWIAAAGLALLLLDGLDGAMARRSGLASAYGARFDVEVDAALTFVLSALAWRSGAAGPEILLLLGPYYMFSLARPVLPWLGGPLPHSLRRKAVCVAQVATPILALALPLSAAAARGLVLAGLGAILWSFLRDIRHLAAQRR